MESASLKLSEIAFHSVRFALRDHVLRVTRETPASPVGPRIQTVAIDGGKRKVALYNLSDSLNSLIGSRGSGKSLMIEALRWCLNLPLGEGDTNYKIDLIHAFLDRGATVIVQGVTAEGRDFRISRSYTGKREQPEPQVIIDGQSFNIGVEAILPGILYFGQKDLGERDKESTENIFQQLLPPVPEVLQDSADDALKEFEVAIDTYLLAKRAQEKDDELKFEENTLTEKLKAFDELGVEDRLKEITGFDQDLRRLRALHTALQSEHKTLKQAYRPIEDIEVWEDVLKSGLTADLKPDMADQQSIYEKARADIAKGIESLAEVQQGVAEIEKKLNAKLKERQDTFAAILRDVNQPDLDIDAYRAMVSRLQHIKETQAKTAEKKGRLGSFERAVVEKGKAWHGALRAITNSRLEHILTINQRLPGDITIHQDFQGDKDSFRGFLEGIFAGSGFTSGISRKLVQGL